MLEGVIAMYSVPSQPMYKVFGSGLIPVDSLKAAGAKAAKKTLIGWLTILVRSGDSRSAIELANTLMKDYDRRTVCAVLVLLGDRICDKCNGTGIFRWKSGNLRECKKCNQTGRITLDIGEVAKKFEAKKSDIEGALQFVLTEESEAEGELVRFLSRERSA